MKPIDLSPELNPARFPAFEQARNRAKRENAAMCVYVERGITAMPIRGALAGQKPNANPSAVSGVLT